MATLTTHVLDTAHGCPGQGIRVEVFRCEGAALNVVAEATTDGDGRCAAPLLSGFASGTYQLHFHAGAYYRARGTPPASPAFLDVVVLQVGLDASQGHYHVPLLLAPYSYSTYRGS